jgi:hypothetical protein
LDPQTDLSFLSNDVELQYTMEAITVANKQKSSSLEDYFADSNPELVHMLSQMLEFNPNFRPTAS